MVDRRIDDDALDGPSVNPESQTLETEPNSKP